jgi:hypothetical protein
MSAARLLAALAVRIAPADRKDWAEALLAELAHVPPAEVTAFAAGGLLAALRLRLTHPAFVLVASRYGLAAGALLWAALHLRLFLHLQEVAPGEAAVRTYLLVTTAIFALGGLITAAAGLRFTCLLGLPMLGLAPSTRPGRRHRGEHRRTPPCTRRLAWRTSCPSSWR